MNSAHNKRAGATQSGVTVANWTFGPYRVEALIGRGGMGEVYRAFDTSHDRVVALKLLAAHLTDDEGYRARFRRECHLAARLREPHVIPIHSYGEVDGRLFLDMRLVEGRDLGAAIADGPVAASKSVDIIGQVARALDAAHDDGLIHRDVKPSNVLMAEDGTEADPNFVFVYLVDFGVARGVGEDDKSVALTQAGSAVGTFDYMPPERFLGQPADRRTDVYSLACLLYECLTGSRPFNGSDLPTLMYAHMNRTPPTPSQVLAGLPRGLDDVIAKGMSKDPEGRYARAGELASAARAALADPMRTMRITPPSDPPPSVPAPPPVSTTPPPQPAAAFPHQQTPAPAAWSPPTPYPPTPVPAPPAPPIWPPPTGTPLAAAATVRTPRPTPAPPAPPVAPPGPPRTPAPAGYGSPPPSGPHTPPPTYQTPPPQQARANQPPPSQPVHHQPPGPARPVSGFGPPATPAPRPFAGSPTPPPSQPGQPAWSAGGPTPPPWTAPGGRPPGAKSKRPLIIALILTAVVIAAVIIIVVVLKSSGSPTAAPTTSASVQESKDFPSPTSSGPSSAGSTTPPTGSFTADQATLGLDLPSTYSLDGCAGQTVPSTLEAIAAIGCGKSSASPGPTAAAFFLYDDTATLKSDFAKLMSAQGVKATNDQCPAIGYRGYHYNDAPDVTVGQMASFIENDTSSTNGSAVIAWTIEDDHVMSVIYNTGGQPTLGDMCTWWNNN